VAESRDQWRALVNTIMNLRVPQNVGRFLNICTTGGFSRRAQLHEVIATITTTTTTTTITTTTTTTAAAAHDYWVFGLCLRDRQKMMKTDIFCMKLNIVSTLQ
jgi:hypothetical protein